MNKRYRPRSGRFPVRFTALTLLLLVGSSLCLFALARLIIRPDAKVNSMEALPAYNIMGQQADRADFWAIARYHNHPASNSEGNPIFAQQALGIANGDILLSSLLQSGLSLPDKSVKGPWTVYDQLQQISCLFVDDIPCTVAPLGQTVTGTVDLSVGWSAVADRPLCYTVLFTPDAQFAPDEDQFTAAYSSALHDLKQLCRGIDNRLLPPLNTLLLFSQITDVQRAGLSVTASENLYALAEEFAQRLLEMHEAAAFSSDLSDPSQLEPLLQDYFREWGMELQVLRLEDHYLILIDTELESGTVTLGLYYSPYLKSWCGTGIQLL